MIDVHSPTWAAVRGLATAQIERANFAVMLPGVEERSADFERGRAAAMKEILRLAESKAGKP